MSPSLQSVGTQAESLSQPLGLHRLRKSLRPTFPLLDFWISVALAACSYFSLLGLSFRQD